jgi:plastocyanin
VITEVDSRQQQKRRKSMRVFVASAIVAFSLSAWGCGSDSATSSIAPTLPNPTSPAPAPTPSGVVTINVVGINGAQSFSPNPASLPAGQIVVWHNVDSITHRVVLNDGTLDTGDLTPGASSQPMSINTGGGPYHCSIHPEMVGTIVPAASTSAIH